MIEKILLLLIVAGFGLAVAYVRAEYASYRGFKAAEHQKLIAQRELHASRLSLRPADAGMVRQRKLG